MPQYAHYHEEPIMTGFEKCRRLLIDLRMERLKQQPDTNQLTYLHTQIYKFPIHIISKAFNAVVDECGWGGTGIDAPDTVPAENQ